MKNLLFLLALLYSSYSALAQAPAGGNTPPQPAGIPGTAAPKGNGKISGTILDATTQQPVSFANVALTNPATGKPVDGTVADEKGKFTLKGIAAGSYTLSITFIGYKAVEKTSILVADKGTDLHLGTIAIATEAKQLKEVTVTGQKALIEEKVDRTVYNAENDATTKGGDATDVLKRVPMLSVDMDGNVSMRGSQNIKVLINGKPSTMAANSIADALKQIPADQIKTVEVITSPSAKYDAEGSGGIINIITKKNNLQGASLNVDASAGTRGSDLRLNGSYRKGKMGFSLGGGGRLGYNVNGSFNNTQMSGSESVTTQQANTRNQFLFGRYTLGWDYDINKYNSLSASVQYGARNMNMYQDHLFTQSYLSSALQSSSLRDVKVADLSGNVDASLNYTHTYEKPQREFSILTLYSRNNRNNDFVNNILNQSDYSILNRFKNENASNNQEMTIQADYQTPVGTNQLVELGGKEIMRQVSSNYTYYSAEGASSAYVPIQNNSLSNAFTYHQNITSGYLSYTLKFLKDYSIKAGTRYEYTTINADFRNEAAASIPSYGVLVPSVNLSRKLKNGNMVKIAYNRRIQRPSLQFLNPNIQASNPLNITQGNPYLQPEYSNNYELSYNTFIKSTTLNFSTFVRNTTGSIQPVRSSLGQDTIRTTYANIGNENAYGFSVFANVKLSDKFTLNGGSDVYYAMLSNNVSDPLYNAKNQGWVPSARMFGNYTLTKGWGLQFFGFYRGRQVQLQGYQGGFGIYSLSLKKDFNEKKGSIGFGAENFFTPAIKIRNEVVSPVVSQNSTNVMHNLSFKVTFSYRIGKLSVDQGRRKKSVNNDDLKGGEGGGDNAGGGQQQQGGGAPNGGGQAPANGGAPKPGQFPIKATDKGQPAGQNTGQRQASDSTQVLPVVPGQRLDSTRTAPGQVQPGDSTQRQGSMPVPIQKPVQNIKQDKEQPKNK